MLCYLQMPKKWVAWSFEEERSLLDARRQGIPIEEIAQSMHRSRDSVAHKAMRLNAGVERKLRHFTKVELRRLRRLYPTASWSELERAFPNRSRVTLSQAAQRLRIRRHRSTESLEWVWRVQRLSDPDAAYIAGLIDGEGTIVARANGQRVMSMGNTNLEVIEWLVAHVGGTFYHSPNGTGLGKKPFWRWHLSRSRVVEALIERMRPYAIIKRQ